MSERFSFKGKVKSVELSQDNFYGKPLYYVVLFDSETNSTLSGYVDTNSELARDINELLYQEIAVLYRIGYNGAVVMCSYTI